MNHWGKALSKHVGIQPLGPHMRGTLLKLYYNHVSVSRPHVPLVFFVVTWQILSDLQIYHILTLLPLLYLYMYPRRIT